MVQWEMTHGTKMDQMPDNYWDSSPTLMDLYEQLDGKKE